MFALVIGAGVIGDFIYPQKGWGFFVGGIVGCFVAYELDWRFDFR